MQRQRVTLETRMETDGHLPFGGECFLEAERTK